MKNQEKPSVKPDEREDHTMTYVIETLRDAISYLEQYRDYSEAMRRIGRGFTPSGPFSPESLIAQLHHAIEKEGERP